MNMKMGKTLAEFKEAYKRGEIELKEDEYLVNGLPYCKKCKTPRFCYIEKEDWCFNLICECQRAEEELKKKKAELHRRIDRFNERQRLSLMGDRYKGLFFKDAQITENNKIAFEKCTNYVNGAKEVYKNNIGLYICGNNSSGKTYLTACLCNELLVRGWRCVWTNLAFILNQIRNAYDGIKGSVDESELMRRLREYDFIFIDDLGKEFIGREYNAGSAKWAEQKLFEIINNRYNAKKPIIFSSNYSIRDLANLLSLDKAIVERINEMSTRVIKLEGDDFRTIGREQNNLIAKKLGI